MRANQQTLGQATLFRQIRSCLSIHHLLHHRSRQLGMGPAKLAAYVGQDTPLAAEYHCTDFDWQEHAEATAHLVEQQWAAAPAAVRQAAQLSQDGVPLSAVAQLLASLTAASSSEAAAVTVDGQQHRQQQQQQQAYQAAAEGGLPSGSSSSFGSLQAHQQPGSLEQAAESRHHNGADPAATTCITSSSSSRSSSSSNDGNTDPASACQTAAAAAENEWEVFYRAHPTAKFFKERRYLLLEFSCLAPPARVEHVVEIGAGCGSSILPVLRAQPQARATVCDVSATCLQQLADAVGVLGLNRERCSCFVADGTDLGLSARLAACGADVALIMFTLSAVPPDGMLAMMRNAAAALRPGGLLCIRDHALYDMVQLRIPGEQAIGRHLYRRGDGTLAYFYSIQDLSGLAVAAGLEVVECDYVCVINRNRKSGLELRRTFVHGVFRRPAAV